MLLLAPLMPLKTVFAMLLRLLLEKRTFRYVTLHDRVIQNIKWGSICAVGDSLTLCIYGKIEQTVLPPESTTNGPEHTRGRLKTKIPSEVCSLIEFDFYIIGIYHFLLISRIHSNFSIYDNGSHIHS
ncbi:hypothetical protein BDA96_07G126600 [Sorghum bicolor]|uniref:Uncharacterized protein n=1 Tax=Sorghum bicolor TaxID=4558 RepID=A0A921QN62_SORBI|nr:hypothetical protein BDA96_07G126600 [Sorghum bicolor]